MGRSCSFASATSDLFALFRLGFPTAICSESLNLAANDNSPDHYAKGTPSDIPTEVGIVLRSLVGTWFQVHCPPLAGVLLIFQSPY